MIEAVGLGRDNDTVAVEDACQYDGKAVANFLLMSQVVALMGGLGILPEHGWCGCSSWKPKPRCG